MRFTRDMAMAEEEGRREERGEREGRDEGKRGGEKREKRETKKRTQLLLPANWRRCSRPQEKEEEEKRGTGESPRATLLSLLHLCCTASRL